MKQDICHNSLTQIKLYSFLRCPSYFTLFFLSARLTHTETDFKITTLHETYLFKWSISFDSFLSNKIPDIPELDILSQTASKLIQNCACM